MFNVAVFDTKPYDRQYLSQAPGAEQIEWNFLDFRLSAQTASTAAGAKAVCLFVNDQGDRDCLELLAEQGVELLALRSAGYNHVDVEAARELGLSMVRVPAYSPHAVAEHTLALLLTLNRKTHRAYNRVRELNFSLNGLVGFDIYRKTVGIVGTGKIGRIAAEIFRGLGAEVIAYDPYPSDEWADSVGVQYVDFNSLLQQSHIVSLHVPLMPDTFHMVDAESLSRTRRGVILINTSRGKLVDTRALIEALKSGHIGGVALDVYEEEEGIFFEDRSGEVLQDDELSRLLTFPNVLVTAHQAFLTDEALTEIARVTTENLLRHARGDAYLEETVV